jgi:large subunit ribosomal protein L10
MNREEKAQQIDAFKEMYGQVQLLVVAENRGLDAEKTVALRKKIFESGGKLRVFKNTLVEKSLGEDLRPEFQEQLIGPNAFMFGGEDFVGDLKTLIDFAKDNKEKVIIKCGLLDGEYIDAEKLKVLSQLPSKDQLRAQVCATMLAPLTGFVNVLAGNVRNLVNVLNNIKEAKETN